MNSNLGLGVVAKTKTRIVVDAIMLSGIEINGIWSHSIILDYSHIDDRLFGLLRQYRGFNELASFIS
jgi:hypothetical protein